MKKGFGLTIMIGEKMDPMMAKKKALQQMMSEKPEFKMEDEMSLDDKENYVSMLVSPEEKDMILKMRKGETEQEMPEGESEEEMGS